MPETQGSQASNSAVNERDRTSTDGLERMGWGWVASRVDWILETANGMVRPCCLPLPLPILLLILLS